MNIIRTANEIQSDLAAKVRELRLSLNIPQSEIARRTGASIHAIQNLESTGKASVATLVQVLKVLGTDASQIIPKPTTASIRPIDVFEGRAPRQRARGTTL